MRIDNEYQQDDKIDIRAEIELTYGLLFIYKNPNYDSIEDLVSFEIGDHITEIGDECFADYDNFNTIIVPSSVTKLGIGSFKNMRKLKELILPNSITQIGKDCFRENVNLTSLTLPTNIADIPENCFKGCKNLESIHIPSSVTKIEKNSFFNCISLHQIELPKQLLIKFMEELTSKTKKHYNIEELEFPLTIDFEKDEIPFYFKNFKLNFFCSCQNLKTLVFY